jgi:hypothetical protein
MQEVTVSGMAVVPQPLSAYARGFGFSNLEAGAPKLAGWVVAQFEGLIQSCLAALLYGFPIQ